MDFAAAATAFTDIYDRNAWLHGSGTGSLAETTGPYRAMLAGFLRDNAIASVVDFGCGDWQFTRLIDWTGIDYHGFEVVPALVAANRARFGGPGIRFDTIGALEDLPPADLLLCKDVLQHLPVEEIEACLGVFATRYRYALITNDVLPDAWLNVEVAHGACRPVRLDLPPFGRASAAVLRWEVRHDGAFSIKEMRLLVRDADALAEAARLCDRVAVLEAEAAALRERLAVAEPALAEAAALRASTSWRATAPLRALTGRLRR